MRHTSIFIGLINGSLLGNLIRDLVSWPLSKEAAAISAGAPAGVERIQDQSLESEIQVPG